MMLGNARQATVRYKSMLMSVVGLLASAAIGFPLNPSFTPEAVKEYKVKADAGDAEAQYLYSSALVDGKGVVKDLPQAFIYAKKAADQGYERALRRIGLGYEQGWGVESNAVKAAECHLRFLAWATKAAELGDVNAQHNLGNCYYFGNGVAKDAKEAVKWYRKAAEQGVAYAQFNLGVCYNNGDGVEKDAKEAVQWYRKAAEQGEVSAQTCLGLRYEAGDGVEKDAKEAVKWYRKAAERGEAYAQNSLGFCYGNGNGVEKDAKEAVKWWRKAAEQGLADAQCNLGVCYDNGNGVEKDEKEAVKWYLKAAEQGDARAQCNLGVCYENGDGVEKDAKEAVKWYRKAAEQGLARAQRYLGDCYYSGDGVEKNEKEAMKWWHKAAEQGYRRERIMSMAYTHAGFVLVFVLLIIWWKWRNGAALNVCWLNSWRRCFDFSGRSSKREYCIVELHSMFLVVLTLFLAALGMDVLLSVRLHEWYWLGVLFNSHPVPCFVIGACLGGCLGGCIGLPLFALAIRRFHDVGKSGWCELLWFVPVWGWIKLWRLLMREGDPAKNKYGDPPTILPSTPNKG